MRHRGPRAFPVVVLLGASLLSTPAFSQTGTDTGAGGLAIFVGIDLGNEYALDVGSDTQTNNGAWLLGTSIKVFLPSVLGIGGSYFQTHHRADDDADVNFESDIRAGTMDLLFQIGDWKNDTKEYVSLHLGGLDENLSGDVEDSAGSYLVGVGIGTTFISRRERSGMAIGAEFRCLVAPDAINAGTLLQGVLTIGFGSR